MPSFSLHIPKASWEKGLNENTKEAHQQVLPEKNSIQTYLRSASPVGDGKTQKPSKKMP